MGAARRSPPTGAGVGARVRLSLSSNARSGAVNRQLVLVWIACSWARRDVASAFACARSDASMRAQGNGGAEGDSNRFRFAATNRAIASLLNSIQQRTSSRRPDWFRTGFAAYTLRDG